MVLQCRLCKNTQNLINLFGDSLSESDNSNRRYYILLATGVNIKEDDVVTKLVCRNCYDFVEAVYNFRVNAAQSNVNQLKQISDRQIALKNHKSIEQLYKDHPGVVVPARVKRSDIAPVVPIDKSEVTNWYSQRSLQITTLNNGITECTLRDENHNLVHDNSAAGTSGEMYTSYVKKQNDKLVSVRRKRFNKRRIVSNSKDGNKRKKLRQVSSPKDEVIPSKKKRIYFNKNGTTASEKLELPLNLPTDAKERKLLLASSLGLVPTSQCVISDDFNKNRRISVSATNSIQTEPAVTYSKPKIFKRSRVTALPKERASECLVVNTSKSNKGPKQLNKNKKAFRCPGNVLAVTNDVLVNHTDEARKINAGYTNAPSNGLNVPFLTGPAVVNATDFIPPGPPILPVQYTALKQTNKLANNLIKLSNKTTINKTDVARLPLSNPYTNVIGRTSNIVLAGYQNTPASSTPEFIVTETYTHSRKPLRAEPINQITTLRPTASAIFPGCQKSTYTNEELLRNNIRSKQYAPVPRTVSPQLPTTIINYVLSTETHSLNSLVCQNSLENPTNTTSSRSYPLVSSTLGVSHAQILHTTTNRYNSSRVVGAESDSRYYAPHTATSVNSGTGYCLSSRSRVAHTNVPVHANTMKTPNGYFPENVSETPRAEQFWPCLGDEYIETPFLQDSIEPDRFCNVESSRQSATHMIDNAYIKYASSPKQIPHSFEGGQGSSGQLYNDFNYSITADNASARASLPYEQALQSYTIQQKEQPSVPQCRNRNLIRIKDFNTLL